MVAYVGTDATWLIPIKLTDIYGDSMFRYEGPNLQKGWAMQVMTVNR